MERLLTLSGLGEPEEGKVFGYGVPGLQDDYEPPQSPDVIVHGGNPGSDARQIVEKLAEKGYVK
jgi:adenylylsulfate kinase-like enzyme